MFRSGIRDADVLLVNSDKSETYPQVQTIPSCKESLNQLYLTNVSCVTMKSKRKIAETTRERTNAQQEPGNKPGGYLTM